MYIDFSKQKLPTIYKRNGKDCYLDDIRQRLIYITPEETVRQQVISYLLNELNVPANAIRVEEHLSHYNIESRLRADIIIVKYDEENDTPKPLVIIECKAPDVSLSDKVFMQVTEYSDLLYADYIMATNGICSEFYVYDADENRYRSIESLPEYIQMVKKEYTPVPEKTPFKRFSLDEIIKDNKWRDYLNYNIGKDSNRDIAMAAANLWDSLLFSDHKMPVGKYKLFELIEDYGLRFLEYGNASGGKFSGEYHSYIIEYNGSCEIVSIGLSVYVTYAKPDVDKTCLIVAIDNEKSSHHSLQLVLDDNLIVEGCKCTFYHHGRIAIGNLGCGSVDELRKFVKQKYPQIIDGKKFNLGIMNNDHLWNIDDEDMKSLVENLISYALIRDEYRAFIKSKR